MASVSHHLWPCLVPDSLAEVDKSRVRLSASMRGRFIISVHPITRTLCVSRRSSYVVLCTTIRWYYDIRENAITVLKMFTFLSKLSKLKLALLALRASRVYASNRVIELETVVWSESSGKEGGDSWAPGIPEIVEHCSTGREPRVSGRAPRAALVTRRNCCNHVPATLYSLNTCTYLELRTGSLKHVSRTSHFLISSSSFEPSSIQPRCPIR